jgi:hypothetical protein
MSQIPSRSDLSNEYYSEHLSYFYTFYNLVSTLADMEPNTTRRVMAILRNNVDFNRLKINTEESVVEHTLIQYKNRKFMMEFVLDFLKVYRSILYTEVMVFDSEKIKRDFSDHRDSIQRIGIESQDVDSSVRDLEKKMYIYIREWLKPFDIVIE